MAGAASYYTKKGLLLAVGGMGGFLLTRYLTRRIPRVIMYHRFSEIAENGKVSKDTFRRQLQEIKDRFHVVSMGELSQLLRQEGSIPDNTLVITIDDGYYDFYDVAYPLLSEYGLPATLYITTDFIDQAIWLWPDRVSAMLSRSSRPIIEIGLSGEFIRLELGTEPARRLAWDRIIAYCVGLTQQERDIFLDNLSVWTGVVPDEIPAREYRALTWDKVKNLAGNGIEIGAHSMTHPILSKIVPEQLDEEIRGCKHRIQEMIGGEVVSFCYPNGQEQDYSPGVKQVVINAGYTSAVTAFYDRGGCTDLFEVRRLPVGDDMYRFKRSVHGVESLLR